ncbi:hypothetical protein POM88_027448 [Heracleum sosnowskyi]|uniref:Uncharacterized protein n=1 Tax=Heracleum sosnowskyi TaxID=360622 RepID=A0AAD8MQ49_9APIA|nr:hypothetical protein POM88_027448 [Heracleum sosnowskyi]
MLCSSAVIADNSKSFTFNILNQQYTVTFDLFCDVLHFPKDRFDPLPTDDELTQFFVNIHYQGPFQMVKLSKTFVVREWDLFFDTIARVFGNCTKTNFHCITSLNQYIAYAIVFGRRLNFAEILWNLLLNRLAHSRRDSDNGVKVRCWYPRFLTLIINHLLTAEQVELFREARFETSPTTDTKFYTRLDVSSKFTTIPVLVSPFMRQFINLPIFGEQVPEPHPVPLQVVIPNLGSSSGTSIETQVVVRADPEIVDPQSLTQVIEPNRESNTPETQSEPNVQTSSRNVSDITEMSVPTALSPPLKKRKTYRETTVSPSVSSQKDMDIDMATTQSLETSSQQGGSIEIRHRAMASCTESSTLPLLTMGEDIHLDDTQDTMSGEHFTFDFETVPTIVTVEVPSQASEGKSDSSPTQIESFSPLPEGTSLAPLRDFPLAVFTGESGRQPNESNTEAIQFQIQSDLEFIGDWDSRTPIAPPLTSLEGARVIFTAGTSTENLDRQLVVRDMSQTPSETQARELSETPLRAIEVSAHTDTNTALLKQLADLQKKLQETQAENTILKAQVVAQSTTSVSNQMGTVKDDLQGLKDNLLPKLNSIQQSQVLVASDISDLTMSNAQISESVREIAAISTKVDFILQTADENQKFNEERIFKIEGGMEHLNEGMKHLYNMIKNSHQPTEEQRIFFEGDDEDEDDADERGDRGEIRRTSEVNPRASTAQTVEDSSTKGENVEKQRGGEAGGSGSVKDKGKQRLTFSDADYYQGEQGDFDNIESEENPEDIFGEVEVEGEADYADWEDEPEVDPAFEAELLRQKADLKRREEENAKVSDIITKHLVIQKAEHQEKQRLHDIKVKDRKLYVRLKLGEEWDRARDMFSHSTGSDNDGKFFSMLERYKKVNPDNTVYMKALHAEISRISTGYDRVREELKIYVYTHNEGTFLVSLNLLESRTLSELWVFMCKVKRTSPLAELLHDQLRDFAMKASPQVVEVPYEVKFFKGRALQTCGVDPISLKDFPAKHLVYLENMLRTSGFATQEKTEVADLIQDYCIANIKRYHQMKNRLKKVTTQPVRPSGITSESDRVLDKDLLEALEEGEMIESEI